MKKRGNRILAFVLMLALSLTSFIYPGGKASAAGEYNTYIGDFYSANANVAFSIKFTPENPYYMEVAILVPERTTFSYNLYAGDEKIESADVTASSVFWEELSLDGSPYPVYYFTYESATPNVEHTLSLTFLEDTNFYLSVTQDQTAPATPDNSYINKTSMTITKGFSDTVKVVGTSEKITWKSSNTKVAAVKNGKVTGKKAGKATITATSASGKSYSCSVVVKANQYTESKMKTANAVYGNSYMYARKVSYDKKGNLVLKVDFLNFLGRKITAVKNINIQVKNKSGKVIGTYTLKSKKVSITHGKTKTLTFTIKKSKLKQKKTQDLRLAEVVSSGTSISRY